MNIKVSIKDVAEKAEVSIATVSRVFNGYSDVSAKTKMKVLQVAKELNYVPNSAARELSSKKYIKIALIINELEDNRKNSIPIDVLNGVYKASKKSNIDFILLLTTEEEQAKKSLHDYLIDNNANGAIIQGIKITDPYFSEIQKIDYPIALIDIPFSTKNVFSVSTDNIKAAYDAIEFLIDYGHKHIGMINGRPEAMVSLDREAGYIKCLTDNNLFLSDSYIVNGDFNEEIAKEKAKELIQNHPELTAIFVASDLMAMGAIKGLSELGYRIPQDISVIGFDNNLISEYINPSLTTVHQDLSLISETAFNLLVDKIKDNSESVPANYVDHKIIVRDSVRKI